MSTLTSLTVRLACDQSNRELLRNHGTSDEIVFYKNQTAHLQGAIFNDDPTVEDNLGDVGNVTEAKVTIRRGTAVGRILLIRTTTAITPCTYAEWLAGTGQHFSIVLYPSDLDLSIPSCGELNIHGTISAVIDHDELTIGQFEGVLAVAGSDLLGSAVLPMISDRLNTITSFTGFTEECLPTVRTTDKVAATNEPYFIRLNGQFVPVYLEIGAANEADEGQVNPLDYNEDTNNKHWVRGL